jgi:hypothetical protein
LAATESSLLAWLAKVLELPFWVAGSTTPAGVGIALFGLLLALVIPSIGFFPVMFIGLTFVSTLGLNGLGAILFSFLLSLRLAGSV